MRMRAAHARLDLRPEESALREVARAHGQMRRAMEPRLARFGLGLAQWGILRTLWRLERAGASAPRVTELCAHLVIQPPSISGAVQRLERMGLVSKLASSSDQRYRHVRLTAAGRRRIDEVLSEHAQWIESFSSCLTRAEQAELARLARILSSHLESLAKAATTQPQA
jgi:DNA-binding MarR family transcriptional regulator